MTRRPGRSSRMGRVLVRMIHERFCGNLRRSYLVKREALDGKRECLIFVCEIRNTFHANGLPGGFVTNRHE